MKLLVNLNNKELDKFLEYTNSFIIGLKDYAVNYLELDVKEIKELLNKYPNIELFVSINKNIFNKELDKLKENLKELNKLKIKGILFYDLSVLKLVKELKLEIDLCIHQTHMVTNYNICNYYLKHGVKYAYTATEITVEEIKEISEKSDISLITYLCGHPIVSHSKRKLVSNFYEFIKKDNNNKLNIIKEKNKDNKYYIEECSSGTNILTYDILNGSRSFLELKDKISYGILDSYLIPNDIFLLVLKTYKDKLDNSISDQEFLDKIRELIGEYEGFFFKKTIYKVK